MSNLYYTEHEVEGGLDVRGWLEGPRGRWQLTRICFSGISFSSVLTRAEANHHHNHHHRHQHHQQHHHQGGGWSEQGGSQSHFLSRLWLLLWAGDYHHPNVAMVAGSAPWRKTFVRGYFRGWSSLFLSFKFFKEAKISSWKVLQLYLTKYLMRRPGGTKGIFTTITTNTTISCKGSFK